MVELAAQSAGAVSSAAAQNRTDAQGASKMSGKNVCVFYGSKQALYDVNLEVGARQVTALIGPSGCGKSTFLRCLNRMNDVIPSCRVAGEITLDGEDIYSPDIDVVELRARVGMVFQKPNPFPKSIYDNIAYGPRIHGFANRKSELDEIVSSRSFTSFLWPAFWRLVYSISSSSDLRFAKPLMRGP